MTEPRAPNRTRALVDTFGLGLAGKALGVLVPLAVAAKFGVSSDTDSYFLASAYAAILLAVWGQAFEQFCLPVLVSARRAQHLHGTIRQLATRAAAGSVLTLAGAVVLALLVARATGALNGWRVATYLLLLGLQTLAASLSAATSAALMANGDYRWPPATYGLRALGALVGTALAPAEASAAWLAAGFGLGDGARLLVLRWRARRTIAPDTAPAPPLGTELGRRAAHQLCAMALLGVAPLAEREVSALLGPGAVTVLEYANKLFFIIATPFDAGFSAIFLAAWAGMVQEGRWEALRADLRRWLWRVGGAASAIAVVVVVAREPIAQFLLRGKFPPSAVSQVGDLLALQTAGLPLYAAGILLTSALLAFDGQSALFALSLGKMLMRTALGLTLGAWAGLPGLALALPLTAAAESLWLVRRVRADLRRRALPPTSPPG